VLISFFFVLFLVFVQFHSFSGHYAKHRLTVNMINPYFLHFHVITKAFVLLYVFHLFNAQSSYPSLWIKHTTCSCFLIEEPLEAGVLSQICCLFKVNI